MRQVKVQYAKTHLSALLADVQRGQDVVIARGDEPVARLVAFGETPQRELGFVHYTVPDEFFDALPESELYRWNGGS